MASGLNDSGGWADLDDVRMRENGILARHLAASLRERCADPLAPCVRLAIVDGLFGPAGHPDAVPATPEVFAGTLLKTVREANRRRNAQGSPSIGVECLMVLAGVDREAIASLERMMAPFLAAAREGSSNVRLDVVYFQGEFRELAEQLENQVNEKRFRNAIYQLDQRWCGRVDRYTIMRLVNSRRSVEVFLSFAAETLISDMKEKSAALFAKGMRRLGESAPLADPAEVPDSLARREGWLAVMERTVFDHFGACVPYVAPFAIHCPNGWRRWLVHFAATHRERRIYNDALHERGGQQAHFGRAGLDMLWHSPWCEDGALHLFKDDDRKRSRDQLPDDIERIVHDYGDTIMLHDFLRIAYGATPAHSDDIFGAIMESLYLEVVAPSGRPRRKAGEVSLGDTLRLATPVVFYPMKVDAIPSARNADSA